MDCNGSGFCSGSTCTCYDRAGTIYVNIGTKLTATPNRYGGPMGRHYSYSYKMYYINGKVCNAYSGKSCTCQ